MATRLIELNEAAQMLGLTPDQLIEMRSNGEIYGYRDGGSWKFKLEEVERVKAERAGGGEGEGTIPFDDGLEDLMNPEAPEDEDTASILVREDTPAPKAQSPSGTVIGKSGEIPPADSDLKLAGDSDLIAASEESDLKLAADSAISLDDEAAEISLDAGPAKRGGSAIDSDVSLVPGVGTDSDVTLVPETGSDRKLKAAADVGADVLGDSELELSSGSAGTGGLTGGSGTGQSLGSSGMGSGDLDIALDSELALGEDDDMVLGGSSKGSKLTLNAADSGINLGSPTDSGLSLEADSGINLQSPTDSGLSLEDDQLEAMASSISALELPEDESIELEGGAFEDAQDLKKDEEFLLSPSDEMFTDESDSGSQVIALEDSAAFDQDAAAAQALLADTAGLDQQLDALGGGGVAATPITSPAVGVAPIGLPEAPYSVWSIIGLLMILMFLSVSGILLSDIVRNMWAWEDGLDVSTSISEGITGAFGLR